MSKEPERPFSSLAPLISVPQFAFSDQNFFLSVSHMVLQVNLNDLRLVGIKYLKCERSFDQISFNQHHL